MTTTVIIGGGIVGLNIALALHDAKKGGEIYLIEGEEFYGHHTSGRNSEVVHAGLAYPPNSLKMKLCVEGNRLTKELAHRLNVPIRKDGKWVLATNIEEAEGLHKLATTAKEGGSVGLEFRDPQEAVNAVPELKLPYAATFSPSTAMIDAASYVKALDRYLSSQAGVALINPCKVTGVNVAASTLDTDRGEMPFDVLINSAGLFADEIYHMSGGKRKFEIRPFKGEYYRWKNGTLQSVIYPVPGRFVKKEASTDGVMVSSLGIHAHRNVGGDLLLGPSQVKIDPKAKTDYSFVSPPEDFIKAMIPFVKKPPTANDLEMAYAGNRPKLYEEGKPLGDFMIEREGNIIHLLGIESPGLTAAPAIGKYIVRMMS